MKKGIDTVYYFILSNKLSKNSSLSILVIAKHFLPKSLKLAPE